MMQETPAVDDAGLLGPTRWQRLGMLVLVAFLVVWGAWVEMRSAHMSRRMGDLDCFLRGAWAVRTGRDLYDLTDNNGFHYNYPPLLAILLAPLADPLPGADRTWMMPFDISVLTWYCLNLLFLAVAVHWLASALDARSWPESRRWWALRYWPIMACLVPIAHTLMRGQSNLLVLALLAAALADVLARRSFRAGIWLAASMCIKIFPAFLVLFPLWRRDGRMLAGTAVGLFLGLVIIPVVVMGPARTAHAYERLTEVLIKPGMGSGTDATRAKELTNITATDTQSLLAILHNGLYPDPANRPAQASPELRLISLLAGGAMTLLTFLAAGWRRNDDPVRVTLFFGCLILDMLFLCPVCHLHYFCLTLPLIMALLALQWQKQPHLHPGWLLGGLLVLNSLAMLLPHHPTWDVFRRLGMAGYAGLLLWVVGIGLMWRRALPLDARPAATMDGIVKAA
jgi:hypothetical protein